MLNQSFTNCLFIIGMRSLLSSNWKQGLLFQAHLGLWICKSVQLFIRWVDLEKLFPCKVVLTFNDNICMWVHINQEFHIFFFAFSTNFALSFSELKQKHREIWGSDVYRNFNIFKISLTPSLNLLKFSFTHTILYNFSLVYIDF